MAKKILFFVDDYGGGTGNVVQILANEFGRMPDLQPIVVFLNPHTKNSKLTSDIPTIEYRLSDNKSKNKLLFLWRNLKTIRKIVSTEKPDCILSFIDNINTNICLSQFFNRSIPIIVSERSNPLVIKPYGLYRYLRPLAYSRANIITVQCEIFKQFMPQFIHKMAVTPNPILKSPIVKTDYNIHGNVKFISCARLHKVKQFDKMIEAFALIHQNYSNCTLTIYGEGPEREDLERLIGQYNLTDTVFLSGATNNTFDKLVSADIYLMTSRQEGFPNSLCEAMAVGLPVVAFECHSGLRDIVDNDNNGFLTAADDTDEMCRCVLRLISDVNLRSRIGIEAIKVTSRFSVAEICKLWRGLIYGMMHK